MTKKGRVENKIALITGGADGIGKSIAALMANEGAKVIVADVNATLGEATAKEIAGEFVMLDVSKEESWKTVMDGIVAKHGGLDILVNNAGILGKGAQNPEETALADWKKIHEINLDGVFLGCKYGIKAMKNRGEKEGAKGGMSGMTSMSGTGASIVNMSSRSGIVGVPGMAAYASSKAAVRNHTKSVALWCAQNNYNIRCNSVHPASVMTAMWKGMLGEGEDFKRNHEKMASGIPLKRFATPEEVAKAVLFLASDESSYTTGSELYIDGGILAGTATSPDANIK